MIIRTNIPAMCAYRESRKTNGAMKKNLQRLSSGLRINSAGDDAAGLSLSERMRAKITELSRAGRNVKEGLALTRTADGALAEINDMLRRVKGLCVEAANGTYSSQELDAISEEINHLFDEVDRITAGTYFNTICLFRGKTGEDIVPPEGVPPEIVPPEPEPDVYEYIETVEALPKDVFEDWGEIQFIHNKPFDRAPGAKQAVAVARLDDSIQTAQDLVGKGIQIGQNRFYLSDGSFTQSGSTRDPDTGAYISIRTLNFSTVKDQTIDGIMNWVVQQINSQTSGFSSNDYETISYNADTRELTLTSDLINVREEIMVDGKKDTRTIPNAKNSWKNGAVGALNVPIINGLKEVDGYGTANNQPIYLGTPTVASDFYGSDLSYLVSDITKDQPDFENALKNNTLVVGDDVIELGKINYRGMTMKQYLEAVAKEISKKPDLTARLDTTEGRIVVTYSGDKTNLRIYENASSAKPTYTSKDIFTCNTKLSGVQIETTQNASSEHNEVKKITFSDVSSTPFTVKINNRNYLFYDSRVTQLPKEDALHRNTADNGSLIDIASYSGVMQAFRSCLMGQTNVGTVKITGENTLEVISKSVNQTMSISITPGDSVTVKQVTTVMPPHGSSERYLFFPQNGGHPFRQTIEIPFHLGETFDKAKLVGSGFTISYGLRFEFVDGAGTGLVDDHADIDISGCTSFDDLIRTLQSIPTFDGTSRSLCYAYLDKSDPYDVQLRFSFADEYSVNVVDGKIGYGGLLQDQAVYSGGEDVGYSNTAIDFSSITKDNLDTLLGKGFRITCATCAGEYINIFFCWENKGQFPESFQHFDAGSGETRTIHNYAVELSKVSDGETIVENIVRTLNPELTHYTTLEVSGDNPSVLIARERRQGDVIDVGDTNVRLANLLTGVRVNFTYNYEKKLVTDDPPDVPVDPDDPSKPETPPKPKPEPLKIENSIVKIFTGSDSRPQFIPIHLPYLDLETLDLTPPERVDLAGDAQDVADLMARVDRANISISSARGAIGADYNRLEHAANDLSISHINLTDAESRVRDGDVAELMVEQTKLQILMQAQQAMMAQANAVAQNVAQLLQ